MASPFFQWLEVYGPVMTTAILVLLVFAVTIHEWAHAAMANRLGDDTPRLMGRLTFDPRSHIDPLGAILFMFVGFGWGRPVLFNPLRLDKRVYELLIALAGPATNLIAALIFNGLFYLLGQFGANPQLQILQFFLYFGAQMNIWLAAFNLIPIPPLDGSNIISYFFPQYKSVFAGQIGLIILLLLLFGAGSLLFSIIDPLVKFFELITFFPSL